MIVLDNRRLTLVEDMEMPHVQPLFALNRYGVKHFALSLIGKRTPAPLNDEAVAPAAIPTLTPHRRPQRR